MKYLLCFIFGELCGAILILVLQGGNKNDM